MYVCKSKLYAYCNDFLSSCLGGLDLLVSVEAGVAWLNQLKCVTSSVHKLVDTKRARDRKILLALLSNAARSTLHQKVHVHMCAPT